MTRIAISSEEPLVAIVVPARLLPQLVALIAAAASAAPAGSCAVETTAEPVRETARPQRPALAKCGTVHQLPARKVG